jgi:hypothetical protein
MTPPWRPSERPQTQCSSLIRRGCTQIFRWVSSTGLRPFRRVAGDSEGATGVVILNPGPRSPGQSRTAVGANIDCDLSKPSTRYGRPSTHLMTHPVRPHAQSSSQNLNAGLEVP